MVAIAPGSQYGSLDDVLETLELTLEAVDGLRAEIDGVAAAVPSEPAPDERPDRLLADVGRLHRRVEEIAEASWRRSEDDRLQGALDAIDRLRLRVDDADPSESVLRTLDLVSGVAARLDADDSRALTELTLEAVEGLRHRVDDEGDTVRTVLDRAVADVQRLRSEIEARDPAEAIELTLEAVDDVGRRVDARADAVEARLAAIESGLTMLTELAATLTGAVAELAAAPPRAVAPPPVDEAVVADIANRVAGALMGRIEKTTAALPSGEQHTAVVASAAAAMSRLEGRLDSDFGSVERSVDRLDRHLAELEDLVRGENGHKEENVENGKNGERANGKRSGLRWRGRAARR